MQIIPRDFSLSRNDRRRSHNRDWSVHNGLPSDKRYRTHCVDVCPRRPYGPCSELYSLTNWRQPVFLPSWMMPGTPRLQPRIPVNWTTSAVPRPGHGLTRVEVSWSPPRLRETFDNREGTRSTTLRRLIATNVEVRAPAGPGGPAFAQCGDGSVQRPAPQCGALTS